MTRERLRVHAFPSFGWPGRTSRLSTLDSLGPLDSLDSPRAHPGGALRVSDTTNISALFGSIEFLISVSDAFADGILTATVPRESCSGFWVLGSGPMEPMSR